MPSRCPVLRPRGAPTPAETDRERGSAAVRGYDRAWQRLRLLVLADEPLCRFCGARGVLRAAEVVDHVETVRDRPDLRLERSNLRPLCKPCHDAHTGRRGQGGADGDAGRPAGLG